MAPLNHRPGRNPWKTNTKTKDEGVADRGMVGGSAKNPGMVASADRGVCPTEEEFVEGAVSMPMPESACVPRQALRAVPATEKDTPTLLEAGGGLLPWTGRQRSSGCRGTPRWRVEKHVSTGVGAYLPPPGGGEAALPRPGYLRRWSA